MHNCSEEFADFCDFQSQTSNDNLKKVEANDVEDSSLDKSSNSHEPYQTSGDETVLNSVTLISSAGIINCFSEFANTLEFCDIEILPCIQEMVNHSQTWWEVCGNFGKILPIEFSKSKSYELHVKSLELFEREASDSFNEQLDLSDDDDLTGSFDMHSLVSTSEAFDKPFVTADQVIQEIEIIMQEQDCDREAIPLEEITVNPACYTRHHQLSESITIYTDSELKVMSKGELIDLYASYEKQIRELSDTLVFELAQRDDLEYCKELKNQFVALLLHIQKRRRERKLEAKVRKSSIVDSINANDAENGHYLTTVIPYEPDLGAPDSERLLIYVKLLRAMKENSSEVPSLLTDYILKVLCPT